MTALAKEKEEDHPVFRNAAAEFIYTRTYSRWIDELKRRETWSETVERYINFLIEERGDKIPPKVIKKIREKVLNFEVMPSMRTLWAAGPAAKSQNLCMYNCSALVIDSPTSFAELFFILMCGAGVGYSVETKYTNILPEVPKLGLDINKSVFIVPDNREGWADSIKTQIEALYAGKDIDFDYSLIRPKGARLKTMGGRASGPAPLINLHNFIKEVFSDAQGRKLTTLECSDICNQIAEAVVSAGIRRSSEISLSNLDDTLMAKAKQWPFPPRRYMSNNSAVYHGKPSAVEFLKEWSELASSGTGERGIFNLASIKKTVPSRRNKDLLCLTNPCGEIILRNKGLCNLSEVVIREDDDLVSILDKIETATWIGVIQSTFTHFPYLSKEWQQNAEEERLLGVSLTGQLDNVDLLTPDALKAMKLKAQKVAKHASLKMGVNMPAAITCGKPSGTVSQLVDSASGIHPRFAKYYIRRYRISSIDPLCKLLKNNGFKLSPENGEEDKPLDKVNTFVVSFPIKSPDKSIVRDQLSAIEQLELYKKVQTNWSEHNQSVTIYVKDEEWFEVGNWVYKNWDIINGVSFLPFDGGKYKQAPYEEISEFEYKKLVNELKVIDYSQLSKYEQEDNTEGAKTWACVGDRCELTT